MQPRLLPRIHPFWLTLGYGVFVGYSIRKYEWDKRIMTAIRNKEIAAVRRNANILLDEAAKRKLSVPVNAAKS